MYFLLKEYTTNPENGPVYDWYRVCSCGAKTHIAEAQRSCNCAPELLTSCPECGGWYGNVSLTADRRKGWCYDKDGIVRFTRPMALLSTTWDGYTVTLHREVINENDCDCNHFAVASSSKVYFDIIHGLRISRIELNGKQLPISATNLRATLSRCDINQLPKDKELKPFVDEIGMLGRIAGTEALFKICRYLLQYPALDSLYQEAQKMGDKVMSHMWAAVGKAINDKQMAQGERSGVKALGLPKPLLKPVLDLVISAKDARLLVEEHGPNVAAEVVCIAESVLEGNSEVPKLAAFLASRTPAERARLKSYLTEETTIYQGIENHVDAWKTLSDYIRMSEEMGVPYQLCPKSLKLQHDLAARNYRLVLSEQEKAEFVAVVDEEEYKRLAWTSKDRKWAVLIPADPEDLIMEGKNLSHCVGSYIGKVNKKETKICFLRRMENLTKPVLTLTVNPESVCTTYLGFGNRNATEEEYNALQEWAKDRGLEIEGRQIA